MENAFATLGIADDLTITEDAFRAAFREAGKSAHPDAGGGEDSFARLQAAMATLSSPSKRLAHWMELRSMPCDLRGSLDPELMDLFAVVGETTRSAESLARRRGGAKSSLVLAMLERETQTTIEAIEAAIIRIDAAIRSETGRFPAFQTADDPPAETLARCVRHLAFLEKWRAVLRSLMPRLL